MIEELKEHLLNIADEIYEDQVALIVIGESDQVSETEVEISAAGGAPLR